MKNGAVSTFAPDLDPPPSFVSPLYEDPEGDLRVGTWGNGIVRVHKGEFAACSTRDGLAEEILADGAPVRSGSEKELVLRPGTRRLEFRFTSLGPAVPTTVQFRHNWNQIEVYVRDHSEAEFSHSICPECLKRLYPEFQKNEGRRHWRDEAISTNTRARIGSGRR